MKMSEKLQKRLEHEKANIIINLWGAGILLIFSIVYPKGILLSNLFIFLGIMTILWAISYESTRIRLFILNIERRAKKITWKNKHHGLMKKQSN